ncbi:MAG: ATP-binding cassette domain-containing protein [Bdellovibrionota bacterium]|nr:ATP-binding cassette domain-containing protein [Pseudomonadota bacterium]MDY6090540.1 ATP-binding cassette domain-containing protein [Bdellovibrionota bacterium]
MLQFETPLLKIKDRVLSKNIKLHIQGPKKVVIIGDNGKGKSTLLNEILTYLKNLNDSSVNVGYLPQNYQETLENSTLSPVDILKKHSDDITTIKTLLGHMNFKRDDMDKSISLLSGGQKCKTLITSLLLQKPNFLFLDEPTNNLYPLSNRAFRQFLTDFPGAALIISHDRMVINEVATKVYKLTNNGLELVK